MKYIIEIDNSNPAFKNSYVVSRNCRNDINQIDYFIDDLLLYNKSEVLEDPSAVVELRGNKAHYKGEFIIFEEIIQEMVNQNYTNVICEVQYKNEKNNNLNDLIESYDIISRNCWIKNKNLCIKFLQTSY